MILRQSPPGHKTRGLEDDVVLAVDNTTKNVIHYQKVQGQEEYEFPLVRKRGCSYLVKTSEYVHENATIKDATDHSHVSQSIAEKETHKQNSTNKTPTYDTTKNVIHYQKVQGQEKYEFQNQ